MKREAKRPITAAAGAEVAPAAQPVPKRVGGSAAIWLCAFVHAAFFVACLPPAGSEGAWPLAFLVPAPLAMLAIRARSMRATLLPLLVAQMCAWLWLFRWIIPVTAVGFPALALYHTVHTILMVWVLRRLALSATFAQVPMSLLLPLVWTAAEFFRGDVAFRGYPWYMIGQPLIDWLSFAQSSDLFGMYFISFLAAVPAGVAMDVVGRRKADAVSARRLSPVTVVMMLLLVANVGYGRWRMSQQASLSPGPRILAIQTNLPQSNKVGWSEAQQAIDIPEFMRLTREALVSTGGSQSVDLIAWPETMVPSLGFETQTREYLKQFGDSGDHLTRWADAVEQLSRDELHVPMLVGSSAWLNISLDQKSGDLLRENEYNSAYLLQGDPPYQRYDKAYLTPYGETMPYISEWKWLERQMLAFGARGMQFNLDANPNIAMLKLKTVTGGEFVIGTPICFEDTVATLCRKMAYAAGGKRADAFVNISNEGWFGDSAGDRILHAQIARFRCIENRVPMVRCANTGISMHIDSAGRVVDRIDANGGPAINSPGWLLSQVQVDSRSTLFGRIGHAFPITCMLLVFGMLIQTFVHRRVTPDADSGASS